MSVRPPSIDQVCEFALRLPCAPSMLPRLAVALQSDDASASQIERLISQDPSLAAATLRLANSAFFGSGNVETVSEAVFRLGAKEIYRLAALVLVGRWSEGVADPRRSATDVSRHALCTAVAAEVLAQKTGRAEPELAYTAGLLCDLGKLALVHSCAEFHPQMLALCEERGMTWNQAEREVLGYTDGEVTCKLLAAWNFPAALVGVARGLTDVAAVDERFADLLAHVLAARYLALALGPGAPLESYLGGVEGNFLQTHGFTAELLDSALPVVLERIANQLAENRG